MKLQDGEYAYNIAKKLTRVPKAPAILLGRLAQQLFKFRRATADDVLQRGAFEILHGLHST